MKGNDKKMNIKSHVTIGTATAFLVNPVLGIPLTVTTVLSAAFGSMIPDLDHPKSKLNQKILPIKRNKATKMFIYCLFGSLLLYSNYIRFNSTLLNFIGAILIMIGISHHRGFTHSLAGIFIFCITVHLFTQKYGYVAQGKSFMVGYVSHLIADFFTEHGIEALYPIDDKNYKAPLRFSTGGSVETVLSIGAMLFVAYRMMHIYY